MIWVKGKIVADEELRISVLDRTFEHGLGLFETMRTWNGRASLLDQHLIRLIEAADQLGIAIEADALPDERAVSILMASNRSMISGDAIVRVTLSGGIDESSGSTLWMRCRPLPSSISTGSARIAILAMEGSASGGWLGRFKTLNYLERGRLHDKGRSQGFDEVLVSDGPMVVEGSRTNIFAVIGQRLLTPSASLAIVPGIMRGVVMHEAARLGMIVEEVIWPRDILDGADEVFLTNAVRGIIPVGQLDDESRRVPGSEPRTWPAPGRWTKSLSEAIEARMTRLEERP